jgi:peptidoglycan/xylan/chitin deacetylase (PgdA/CDA1 family)
VQYVLDHLHPGAIVLAHDPGDLTAGPDGLTRLIRGARALGYVFTTVSELVSAGNPVQGDAL